jgi:hypothetical protein
VLSFITSPIWPKSPVAEMRLSRTDIEADGESTGCSGVGTGLRSRPKRGRCEIWGPAHPECRNRTRLAEQGNVKGRRRWRRQLAVGPGVSAHSTAARSCVQRGTAAGPSPGRPALGLGRFAASAASARRWRRLGGRERRPRASAAVGLLAARRRSAAASAEEPCVSQRAGGRRARGGREAGERLEVGHGVNGGAGWLGGRRRLQHAGEVVGAGARWAFGHMGAATRRAAMAGGALASAVPASPCRAASCAAGGQRPVPGASSRTRFKPTALVCQRRAASPVSDLEERAPGSAER